MERRHSRALPGFNGQNFIHTNPLPAVSNLPSFSYGSPQNTLPKQPTLKDTRLRMGDALQQADEAAKKRIEAQAAERKRAEDARKQAKEGEANEQAESTKQPSGSAPADARSARRTPRGRKASDTPGPVRRSLRSQSVASRGTSGQGSDDERDRRSESVGDFEGDATVNEIHSIISRAQQQQQTAGQHSVLKSRSVNIHRSLSPEVTSKPRSAMKGSRDSIQRVPANARAKRNGQSSNDVDVTYNEEFNGMGHRVQSPGIPRAPNRLGRIQESDAVSGDDNHNAHDVVEDDGTTNQDSTKVFPRFFNVFGSNKARDSDVYDHQGPSWISILGKKFLLFVYFMKHLLRSGVVIGLFLLVISGIVWSLYNIGGVLPIFKNGPYRAPPNPPATYNELYSRLTEVERHLQRWTEGYQQDTAAWKSLSNNEKAKRAAMEKELAAMSEALSKLSGVTNEFHRYREIYIANEDATKTVLHNVQSSLSALDNSVKGSALESASVKKQLIDIQTKIEVVREDISRLEFANDLNQKALRKFEEALPQQLAVKLDPTTGKLSISPEIWRHLQSLLRKDIEHYTDKVSHNTKKDEANRIPINSWDDFLAKNEAKLRGYIGTAADAKWRSAIADDVVISKEQMVKLVEDKITSLRSEFENKNRDLYSKYTSRDQNAASANEYGVALIQSALHLFSATVLRKPDYAQLARGTQVIPHLTSSSYRPPKSGAMGFFASYWEPEANLPTQVLEESMKLGDCWTFPHTSGHVSIYLAEAIYPSEVTVDHIPKALLGDGRSAPRDMEFWIRVDDDELREQVHKAATVALKDSSPSPRPYGLIENNFVRIAAFTYDIDSAYPTQTFDLPVLVQNLGVKVEDVSFRVLNNWGNEDFTSLYRVRVHGTAVEKRVTTANVE